MLILRPSNSGFKEIINIQKCGSSTKVDQCALSFDAYKYSQLDVTGLPVLKILS